MQNSKDGLTVSRNIVLVTIAEWSAQSWSGVLLSTGYARSCNQCRGMRSDGARPAGACVLTKGFTDKSSELRFHSLEARSPINNSSALQKAEVYQCQRYRQQDARGHAVRKDLFKEAHELHEWNLLTSAPHVCLVMMLLTSGKMNTRTLCRRLR